MCTFLSFCNKYLNNITKINANKMVKKGTVPHFTEKKIHIFIFPKDIQNIAQLCHLAVTF